MEKYQPISCSFYDRLEEAATLAKHVELIYKEENDLVHITTVISNLELKDKVEYMILNNGSKVRLDQIHSINGVKLESHC